MLSKERKDSVIAQPLLPPQLCF